MGLVSVMCVLVGTVPAEMLYNGIELPKDWPPKLDERVVKPIRPPYLDSPPDVIPIDVGRQLFVDDFLIERTTLKRTLHSAELHPASPVLSPDKAWEKAGKWKDYGGSYAIPFSDGVWHDPRDKLFKMWYMGGLLYSTCYATSKDGIHWHRPNLDVRPGTNIVHPGNRDSCTVWLDLDENDPKRRYKMFRFQKTPRRGLVLHYSEDGVHWGGEVAWAGKCHDRTTVFYNPFRKVWVCSIKATLPPSPPYKMRVRRYNEGSDPVSALRWGGYGDPPLWLGAERPDPHQPDRIVPSVVYNLDAVAYESVMLGLFSIHQAPADKKLGRPKQNRVFAGFSRDGFHWHRPYVKPLFGVSERKGDWNWGNVQSVGGCCLIVGDKLYFYHSGRAGTGRSGKHKGFWDADASTGLAVLRRDGFASMDAGNEEATLTTRPVRFKGKHVFVNVDAGAGELRVELLDVKEQVIPEFSKAICEPIRADKTLQPVRWRGTDDVSGMAGKPVRLRFYLRSGRLYAFWASPDESGASHGYVAAGGPGLAGPTDTVGARPEVSESPVERTRGGRFASHPDRGRRRFVPVNSPQ